jgi:hypothetical protein
MTLARLQTDVLAYSPDIALLLGGTNDLVSGMANSAYTALVNNLEQMVLQILRSGAHVVLVTPPVNNNAPAESRSPRFCITCLLSTTIFHCLDMYRLTADPVTGNDLSFVMPANQVSGGMTPEVVTQDIGNYTANNLTLWNKSTAPAIWTPGKR